MSPFIAYVIIANMYLTMEKIQSAIDVLRKSTEDHDAPYLRAMLRRLELGGVGNLVFGEMGK